MLVGAERWSRVELFYALLRREHPVLSLWVPSVYTHPTAAALGFVLHAMLTTTLAAVAALGPEVATSYDPRKMYNPVIDVIAVPPPVALLVAGDLIAAGAVASLIRAFFTRYVDPRPVRVAERGVILNNWEVRENVGFRFMGTACILSSLSPVFFVLVSTRPRGALFFANSVVCIASGYGLRPLLNTLLLTFAVNLQFRDPILARLGTISDFHHLRCRDAASSTAYFRELYGDGTKNVLG